MLKIVAGLVAGLVVALASVYVVWLVAMQVYPLSTEGGYRSVGTINELVQTMPTGAQLFIALGWLSASFLGALTAAEISRRLWPGWVIVALVACSSIAHVYTYPQAAWMDLAAFVVPVVGGILAGHWARRSRRASLAATVSADA